MTRSGAGAGIRDPPGCVTSGDPLSYRLSAPRFAARPSVISAGCLWRQESCTGLGMVGRSTGSGWVARRWETLSSSTTVSISSPTTATPAADRVGQPSLTLKPISLALREPTRRAECVWRSLRAASRFEVRCQWCLAEPAKAECCRGLRAAFAYPRRELGTAHLCHSCVMARQEYRLMISASSCVLPWTTFSAGTTRDPPQWRRAPARAQVRFGPLRHARQGQQARRQRQGGSKP